MAIKCEDLTIRETITAELEQIKGESIDSDQKLKVISKDKIKEVLGRSPDYADTLMMRMWFELRPTFIQYGLEEQINYNREISTKQFE
jgi:hypothetical protein